MSAKHKVAVTVAPSSTVAPRGAAPRAAEYSLTPERSAALTVQANAVTTSGASFPGRLAQRIRRFGEIRLAAERDAADLVRTPFHGEPPITVEEIQAQRDRIEFLRITESRYQALRGTQKQAFTEFETFGAEAAAIRARLLRTFDVRFAKDAKGKKRVSAIREGSGDPDLVQDVSDLLVLCGEHVAYLAGCPRGEAADVARLRELSPILSHLLAAKGMGEEAVTARKLRDGAYTLVMQTESRLRIGATYWYEGTDKLKDYAMFVAPAKGSAADVADPADVGEAVSPAAPAVPA
jgi:hypothetical protein